jgi:predicted metal-dependent enzyme (double-stranded beta helix superfamily)
MLVGMLDVDSLIEECVHANQESEQHKAIREVLERACADRSDATAALKPERAGLTLLHHTPDLTVIHVVWAPGMHLFPHNHRMWAAIGIYAGQEDNAFYRRPAPDSTTVVESGGKSLAEGDVLVLGDDAIHAVTNPRTTYTGAIHVYGGDFVNEPRSQWGPGPLEERPYAMESTLAEFEAANDAWLGAAPDRSN